MPVTLEQGDASSLVLLQGDIGVECAAELKELLMQGLKPGSALHVSLESATGLDVTAVQLFWAASREAIAVGAEFAFKGQAPESVRAELDMYGIGELPVSA